MEESVDFHKEAGKENEQTLANLSPAEEATSKDEDEIENFLQEQRSKKHFLVWPYNKRLINQARSVCMGGS